MTLGSLRHRSITLLVASAVMATATAVGAGDQAFGRDDWESVVRERGLDPNDVVYPFEVSPTMEAWARRHLEGHRGRGPMQELLALQGALFAEEKFEFAYDDTLTLTAQEAFEHRRGNCMSFTALFIGLSRSVGIPTFLVSVRRAPEVERSEGLVVVNRHVVAGYRTPGGISLYDFYVTSSAPYVQHTTVDDIMASTMYHTNLGGAAIRDGDLDLATHHLDIATRLEPSWPAGWVNLGVARFRSGKPDAAMEAYRTALEVDPGNSSALTNMSFVYRHLGLAQEARAALAAAARQTDNPFTLIAMADLEMVGGNLDRAARHLRKARWWYGDEPAVHDALARLARREGREERARKHSLRAAKLRQERDSGDGPSTATE